MDSNNRYRFKSKSSLNFPTEKAKLELTSEIKDNFELSIK